MPQLGDLVHIPERRFRVAAYSTTLWDRPPSGATGGKSEGVLEMGEFGVVIEVRDQCVRVMSPRGETGWNWGDFFDVVGEE